MFVFYCMNCSILRCSNESMYFQLLLWFCVLTDTAFFFRDFLGNPDYGRELRRSLRLKWSSGFVQRPPEPSSCQKFTRFREPAGSAQCWGTCAFLRPEFGGGGWSHIVSVVFLFFW